MSEDPYKVESDRAWRDIQIWLWAGFAFFALLTIFVGDAVNPAFAFLIGAVTCTGMRASDKRAKK